MCFRLASLYGILFHVCLVIVDHFTISKMTIDKISKNALKLVACKVHDKKRNSYESRNRRSQPSMATTLQ